MTGGVGFAKQGHDSFKNNRGLKSPARFVLSTIPELRLS